ncbi:ASCH domain-containing protein [Corynebacterium sp. P7202]|uniref:ASCH domain-containing protein n=1 Tax=Corynebacterium pygosceleis TaxID=2800406 RepID=A0A9Q4CAE5_9CORY|nr:ASCH domain-containing protein [Corynebacterium pygosceleis]MCK7637847.1 ASCH domain-containing protein [Corynebacterium pygosceleis]MCX7444613.1 ASCH domain-containing protein [Corynebacterium pygosceleis]MCX7468563.1 ASCH domain-containing protein [Corynebacterium pygosceleis]
MMDTPPDPTLPISEFAFPGPLRDALVAAILSGDKTATSTLLREHEAEGTDPRALPGTREVVVDSDNRPVCVVETTDVAIRPFGDVDDEFARAEGEGYTTAREWASAHLEFWHSTEYREAIGDPHFTVSDETPVVCTRFRVVQR